MGLEHTEASPACLPGCLLPCLAGEWAKLAPLRILSVDIECAGRKANPWRTSDMWCHSSLWLMPREFSSSCRTGHAWVGAASTSTALQHGTCTQACKPAQVLQKVAKDPACCWSNSMPLCVDLAPCQL